MPLKFLIYGDEAGHALMSNSGTAYSLARSGGGTLTVESVSANRGRMGQTFFNPNYVVYENFLGFDTSSVPSGTISGATIRLASRGLPIDTAHTFELRVYDWGPTVTTSDWIHADSLSGLTLVATLPSTSYPATSGVYADFIEDGTSLRGAINRSGFTRVVGCTDRVVAGATPTTTGEAGGWLPANTAGTTSDPLIVVEIQAEEVAFTDTSQTLSWQAPSGVTSIQVEGWGSGGGGGTGSAQEPGGGGGAYGRSTIATTPGETLYIKVPPGGAAGAVGADAIVSRNSNLSSPIFVAKGAKTAASGATVGGAGLASEGTADVGFNGGAGGAEQGGGGSRTGSGGGSSGGFFAAGNPGQQAPASGTVGTGGTAPAGGGNGGDGGAAGGAASAGSIPGGGGGGKGSGTATSGAGARGHVLISYVDGAPPPAANFYPPFPPMLNTLLRM